MRVNAVFMLVQLALTCVGGVYAQTPLMPSVFPTPPASSTSPISQLPSSTSPPLPSLSATPCITQCFALAVSASNCGGLGDANCVCNDEEFGPRYMRCVSTDCPDQADAAELLVEEYCSAPVPSSSVSPSGSDSSNSSDAPSSASSGPASGNTSPTVPPTQDDGDDGGDTVSGTAPPDSSPDGRATALAPTIILPTFLLFVLVNVGLPL